MFALESRYEEPARIDPGGPEALKGHVARFGRTWAKIVRGGGGQGARSRRSSCRREGDRYRAQHDQSRDERTRDRRVGSSQTKTQRRRAQKKIVHQPSLVDDLKGLVEPHTSGSPMQALLWASRSLAHLAEALKQKGHAVSTYVIRCILKSQGYSLQAKRKTHEGGKHPDRDAQFLYIAAQKEKYLTEGNPVLSIDGKKKEL